MARKTGVIEQVSVADGSLVAEFKDYKGSVVNLWGTERSEFPFCLLMLSDGLKFDSSFAAIWSLEWTVERFSSVR